MSLNRRTTLALAAAAALALGGVGVAITAVDDAGPATAAALPAVADANAPNVATLLVCPGDEVITTHFDHRDEPETRTPEQAMADFARATEQLQPRAGKAMLDHAPAVSYKSQTRTDYVYADAGGKKVAALTFEQRKDKGGQPVLVMAAHCNR